MDDHAKQHGVHFDPATMQMFQAFAIFMQQHHATKRREILATKAIQAVVNKMNQFDGKNVTRYLRKYIKEMELHRVSEGEMIQSFEVAIVNKMNQFDGKNVTRYLRKYIKEMELHRVSEGEMIQSFEVAIVPKFREHVRAIKILHGINWEELKLGLKEEYFMDGFERGTKRTFFEWVARPKEGILVTELLKKFEWRYAQLTRMENATLDAEKTELFLQAAGKEFQEKLELLLEGKDAEQGLKTNWNDVEDVVSLLSK
ncbi:hypothetical protein L7F22_037428 [Adiantum nelumboides]|nr:hypothetical protein [Adiantum nelumboides]